MNREKEVTIRFKAPARIKRIAERHGSGNVSEGIRLLINTGLEASIVEGLKEISENQEKDCSHFWLLT